MPGKDVDTSVYCAAQTTNHVLLSTMAYGRKRGGNSKRPQYGAARRGKREEGRPRAAMSQLLTGERKAQRDWETKHDDSYGYETFSEGAARVGYLTNMLPTSIANEDRVERSALDLYFLQQDGGTFKAQLVYEPYFYVVCGAKWVKEVSALLEKKFEGLVAGLSTAEMEDLDLPNHLSGIQRTLLKLQFRSVQELMEVRNQLQPIVAANKRRVQADRASAAAGVSAPAAFEAPPTLI